MKKQKKRREPERLQLGLETLRQLATTELAQVGGGLPSKLVGI
jgi:hypothetical protein